MLFFAAKILRAKIRIQRINILTTGFIYPIDETFTEMLQKC